LKREDEEEVHAVYLDGDQGCPENQAVGPFNGDTQQEDTDAAFEEDVRDNVSWFAGPPPLNGVVSIVRYCVDVILYTFMPLGYFSSGMRYRRFPVPFCRPSSARVANTKKDTRVAIEK
jgi:hypothetical protein